MNVKTWKEIFTSEQIVWKRHALERMAEREITQADVLETIISGKCIEYYADGFPFPSALFSMDHNGRSIHVVAAIDEEAKWGYIITAYVQDIQHFMPDYLTRRSEGD